MYTAMEVARYIVKKCIDDACPITNLQLQKILYYVQLDFLNRGEAAFSDEIEAWQFGPVVPEVYYHYSMYAATPIRREPKAANISKKDAERIDVIVVDKRKMQPWELVKGTHKKGGAWHQIYRDGEGIRNVIPKELIKTAG